jgi:hypothetical protein
MVRPMKAWSFLSGDEYAPADIPVAGGWPMVLRSSRIGPQDVHRTSHR